MLLRLQDKLLDQGGHHSSLCQDTKPLIINGAGVVKEVVNTLVPQHLSPEELVGQQGDVKDVLLVETTGWKL